MSENQCKRCAGVMHNLGNLANSVGVAVDSLRRRIETSRGSRVGDLAKLIEEHADDLGVFLVNDPRGRQVPAYLATLADHLADEHTVNLEEIDRIQRAIEHISKSIKRQQETASKTAREKKTPVAELVPRAVQILKHKSVLENVALDYEISGSPQISVDEYRTLHILVNLISNAIDAVTAVDRIDKHVIVRVALSDEQEIRIDVEDNGVGISPDHVSRVLKQGFSTKESGHGYGLYSAALAAEEMGGALSLSSDGEGRGAIFTLTIPVEGAVGS